jgi:hypothetical protein
MLFSIHIKLKRAWFAARYVGLHPYPYLLVERGYALSLRNGTLTYRASTRPCYFSTAY